MPPSYDPEEVAYVSDRLSVNSAATLLRAVSLVVLVVGAGGVVFTAGKLSAEETDAVAVFAYALPVGLLVALTWGALYGLTAVIRALRVIAVASRLENEDAGGASP